MNLRLRLEAVCGSRRVRGEQPLIVRPADEAALRGALAAAAEAGVPTKLEGLRAHSETEAAVTFELSGFDELELDRENHLARVGAGLPVSVIEQRLEAEGFSLRWGHLPPIPVGVWLAAHAGAIHSPRGLPGHGPVAGVEAVLWDGTPLRSCLAPRSATGPELSAFFLGARARFGLLTRLHLRVHPAPAERERLAWTFPGHAAALRACVDLLEADLWPEAMTLHDGAGGVQLCWELAESAVQVRVRRSAAEIVARGAGGAPAPAGCERLAGSSELRAATADRAETAASRAWLLFSQVEPLVERLRAEHPAARLHLEAVAPEGAAAWIVGLPPAALDALLAEVGALRDTPPAELALLDAVAAKVFPEVRA
ncbi:MAG: FAD-binding protein [Deltaproteobacteria bacterium]|nr:FAD-binding protein [Deltaproteobacteria bacterium]